jgi:hypothetical protein
MVTDYWDQSDFEKEHQSTFEALKKRFDVRIALFLKMGSTFSLRPLIA